MQLGPFPVREIQPTAGDPAQRAIRWGQKAQMELLAEKRKRLEERKNAHAAYAEKLKKNFNLPQRKVPAAAKRAAPRKTGPRAADGATDSAPPRTQDRADARARRAAAGAAKASDDEETKAFEPAPRGKRIDLGADAVAEHLWLPRGLESPPSYARSPDRPRSRSASTERPRPRAEPEVRALPLLAYPPAGASSRRTATADRFDTANEIAKFRF